MRYQLIIKLWRPSLGDESRVDGLEAAFKAALGDSVETEGIDTHEKEFNFFMLTEDPKPAFRKCRDVLESTGISAGVSAAYRLNGGAQFTSIWPLRNLRKFKLPGPV